MAKRKQPGQMAKLSKSLPEDLLDCPICCEKMIGRIFQCSMGHCVCEECLDKLATNSAGTKACPSCNVAFPAVGIRNLAMERLAESCSFPCRFGCGFEESGPALKKHMKLCDRRAATCVVEGCRHTCCVRDLIAHLQAEHHRSDVSNPPGNGTPETPFTLRYTNGSADAFWSASMTKPVVLNAPAGACIMRELRCDGTWFRGAVFHLDQQLRYKVRITDPNHNAVAVEGLTSRLLGPEPPARFQIHREMAERLGHVAESRYQFAIEVTLAPVPVL